MAKKIIPAAVVGVALTLTVAQVEAVMAGGGAAVALESVECLGMMPGGAFIYRCKGQYFTKVWRNEDAADLEYDLVSNGPMPDYLDEFKIKLTSTNNAGDARGVGNGWLAIWG